MERGQEGRGIVSAARRAKIRQPMELGHKFANGAGRSRTAPQKCQVGAGDAGQSRRRARLIRKMQRRFGLACRGEAPMWRRRWLSLGREKEYGRRNVRQAGTGKSGPLRNGPDPVAAGGAPKRAPLGLWAVVDECWQLHSAMSGLGQDTTRLDGKFLTSMVGRPRKAAQASASGTSAAKDAPRGTLRDGMKTAQGGTVRQAPLRT